MVRTMVPKARLALTVSWAPGPWRGQGCCLPGGLRLLASRAPAPRLPACQHDCACHEPQGRGRHARPPTWRSAAPAGQTHTVCGPRIPGLLGARSGPPPGKHHPAPASPLGASFYLGKSQLPHSPLLAGPSPVPCWLLCRSEFGKHRQGNKTVKALAPELFPARGLLRILLNLCCASIFSSAKWG